MELKVYKIDGSESTKTVKLNEDIFNVEPNDHAIWLDVKQYLANQRQGTHDTLEKSTISGSTRKLKKTKSSTGGAREGASISPTIRGGATAFGPHPRDYSFKLNKKIKKLARFSALSYKAKEGKITVVEDFAFDAPKTKAYIQILKNLNLTDPKTLVLVNDTNNNVYISSRNVKRTKVIRTQDVNTYDVLNASNLIICENSLPILEAMLR